MLNGKQFYKGEVEFVMDKNLLREQIDSLVSAVTFEYKGKRCGVDPLSHHHYDVWYGAKCETMTSIDQVMDEPFFDDQSLAEIAPNLKNVEIE